MDGHLLYYKNDSGEWIPIPVSVISVYDAYVAYCNKNNIAAISETEYYSKLAEIDAKLDAVNTVLGNTQNLGELQSLIDTLTEGVLPTTLGGTGKPYANWSAFIKDLSTALNDIGLSNESRLITESQLTSYVSEQLNDALATRLEATEIGLGPDKPEDTDFQGTYYFQHE